MCGGEHAQVQQVGSQGSRLELVFKLLRGSSLVFIYQALVVPTCFFDAGFSGPGFLFDPCLLRPFGVGVRVLFGPGLLRPGICRARAVFVTQVCFWAGFVFDPGVLLSWAFCCPGLLPGSCPLFFVPGQVWGGMSTLYESKKSENQNKNKMRT